MGTFNFEFEYALFRRHKSFRVIENEFAHQIVDVCYPLPDLMPDVDATVMPCRTAGTHVASRTRGPCRPAVVLAGSRQMTTPGSSAGATCEATRQAFAGWSVVSRRDYSVDVGATDVSSGRRTRWNAREVSHSTENSAVDGGARTQI